MMYFLLTIITIQSAVILIMVWFILKHFTITIEEIEESTVEQAEKDAVDFLAEKGMTEFLEEKEL